MIKEKSAGHGGSRTNPEPQEVRAILSEGNRRFVDDTAPAIPAADFRAGELASSSNQAEHALATVLTCSDSRVPVEHDLRRGHHGPVRGAGGGQRPGLRRLASLEYGVLARAHPASGGAGPQRLWGGDRRLGTWCKGPGPGRGTRGRLCFRPSPRSVHRAMADARPEAERESAVATGPSRRTCGILWPRCFKRLSPVLRGRPGGRFKAMGAIYDLASGVVNWLEDENPAAVMADGR